MTDIFPIGARIAIYCRDSGGDTQDLSITQQLESLGNWASENGVIITRSFSDNARSGSRVAGRDQFLSMMDYFSTPQPEVGVLFWELSRFARDYNDAMYYLSDLRRHGLVVYSMTDALPPGLDGQLMESVKAWSNARFLLDLKKNVKRGLHYVVSNHHAHIGHVPVGYKMVGETISQRRDGTDHTISHLVPDETYAPLVKRAFEMRAMGATYKEIDAELHLFEWLHNYGRLFRRRLYMGVKDYGELEIPNFCPPLVSKETWEAANRVQLERASRTGVNHPRTVRSRYWLTGLLKCNRCGMPMHAHAVKAHGKEIRGYYKCSSRVTQDKCDNGFIPKGELEARVMDALRTVTSDRHIIDQVYEEAQAQELAKSVSSTRELSAIAEKLSNNEKQIARLLAAIKETGHSRAMLEELSTLERYQSELQQASIKLEVSPKVITVSRDEIVNTISAALDAATEQQRGILARGFITNVKADRLHGKQISGWITIQPLNLGAIVVPL